MSVRVESNFDGLKKLQENLQNLSQQKEVSLGILFNDNFMSQYTSLSSFNKLIEAGGFKVNSAEDFKAIPDTEWEVCIQENTSFSSWKEMQSKSMEEYLKKQLSI
ncbi:MAG: hypothetical protein K0R18_1992 [Bacillales bacterium]|jgi:hypothetical protein|nr:hypothetical protein [Bacillales bacterium]